MSADGKVTFKKAGTVSVYVNATDGSEIFASCMMKYAPSSTGSSSSDMDDEVTIEKLDSLLPEMSAVNLTDGDFTLELGDNKQLRYEDPDGKAVFFGSFDGSLLAIDRETGMMEALGLGTTTVFVSAADTAEVKAMANVTIVDAIEMEVAEESEEESVNEIFEHSETSDIMAEEDTKDIMDELKTEVQNVTEEDSSLTVSGDEIAEDETGEAEVPEIPETQEPEATAEEPVELNVDIPEGFIYGDEGMELTLERDLFLNSDEKLANVKFRVEDESMAMIDPEANSDIAKDGLKIKLLSTGLTTLFAETEDGTKVFEILLIVNPAPVQEETPADEPVLPEADNAVIDPAPAADTPAQSTDEPESEEDFSLNADLF